MLDKFKLSGGSPHCVGHRRLQSCINNFSYSS